MTVMSLGRGRRRAGGTLRTRLLILVLVPLLGMAAFAAWEIQQRTGRVAKARRVESLVATTSRVAETQRSVLGELVPSMARVIVSVPSLAEAMGLSDIPVSQLGLTAANIKKLRAATDATVTTLSRDPRTAALAVRTGHEITEFRAAIDSVVNLTNGFYLARNVITQLTAAQARIIARAFHTGLGTSAGTAISDLSRVTQLVQYAQLEIADLTGAAYPSLLAANDPHRATRDWLQVWGGYNAARDNLLAVGASTTVHALKTAIATPAARGFDTYADQAAESPDPSRPPSWSRCTWTVSSGTRPSTACSASPSTRYATPPSRSGPRPSTRCGRSPRWCWA